MMKNIPSESELLAASRELLDTAWEVIADLLKSIDEAKGFGIEIEPEDVEEYWRAAKRHLSTSLSIVQQAVELGLKGKIAAISPFLLIADPPSRWPKDTPGVDGDFLKLRTIDAQDLVKVFNTFSATRLSENFIVRFNTLREKRNIIVHTAAKDISIQVLDVIDAILYMFNALFPGESWGVNRLNFLNDSPGVQLWHDDNTLNTLSQEVSILLEALSPAKVKEYLGVDKKARRYVCPHCHENSSRNYGFDYKLALLQAPINGEEAVNCIACDEVSFVERIKCTNKECKGDVVNMEGMCLSCLSYQ